MHEKVTVKVCAKYKISINCISLEILLHVESCKPMWNLTLRYKMYAWRQCTRAQCVRGRLDSSTRQACLLRCYQS